MVALVLKVAAVWLLADLVVFLPLWIAAHGGVRSDR
jgi:hypothetical protein